MFLLARVGLLGRSEDDGFRVIVRAREAAEGKFPLRTFVEWMVANPGFQNVAKEIGEPKRGEFIGWLSFRPRSTKVSSATRRWFSTSTCHPDLEQAPFVEAGRAQIQLTTPDGEHAAWPSTVDPDRFSLIHWRLV